MALLYVAGAVAAFFFVVFALDWRKTAKELGRRSVELSQLESKKSEFEQRKAIAEQELNRKHEALDRLVTQKSSGFPYLADAWADFLSIQDRALERVLKTKSRPALKGAEAVKKLGAERRASVRTAKIFEYKIKLYETLFPWLTEFTEEGIDDAYLRVGGAGDGGDEDLGQKWISPGEWNQLSVSQRNQLALDRYCARRKTPWEIGRDYERFVGHLCEEAGCHVHYMGAVEGFDDLGRDLVVKDGRNTKIIQCKYWADHKQIHEKHIFQLFGTCVEYGLRKRFGEKYEGTDLFGKNGILDGIEPVLYTSTKLSDRAKAFASALGVSVFEAFRLSPYPMIKCNIAQNGGEKIYHLPFDQQYDKVLITKQTGECYATTIEEAEALGFRRAFRWISKT